MSKPIILIDDTLLRLEKHQESVKLMNMNSSVDLNSELYFCSITNSDDLIFNVDFNKSDVKVIFIHSSYNDPKFPENRISLLRNSMKPCPVVGFSGQTKTDLSVPKLRYTEFDNGFITFLTVFKNYNEILLSSFTSPLTWTVDLAKRYFFDIESNADYESVKSLIDSHQFRNLLKLSGLTYSDVESELSSSVRNHNHFLKFCQNLVEDVQS
ncbi:MAG: hypothetical protein H7319_15360 [Spirosoma sp.]|nr:hypothetical protein [Spirosoma sp.]